MFKRSRDRTTGPRLIYATQAAADAAEAERRAAGFEPGYHSLRKDGGDYIIFRGTDPEKAKRYLLDRQTVTEERYYVVVETPDGNWGKDIEGLYLENLRPWQTNISAADCAGTISALHGTFGVTQAAQGVTDNFICLIACGKCRAEWYDGLRYQNLTAVRCPVCGALNKVDSRSITVH